MFAECIEESVIYLSPVKDESKRNNVKYSIRDYAIAISDVLLHATAWYSYSGPIPGNALNKKHLEWLNLGVYEHAAEALTNEYFKTVPKSEELKYQSVDSSFIRDKNG